MIGENYTLKGMSNSCPKDVEFINSVIWENLTKSGQMMSPTTTCGLATAIQADQTTVEEIGKQLEDMSKKIIDRIHYLEGLDSQIVEQTGMNKKSLDTMLDQYKSYNKQFAEYKTKELQNINGILMDTSIVVKQENYSYILWSVLAITGILIAFTLIKKNNKE